MARIRTIKPEFFTSEDIVSMSPLARLFYVGLWCEADRLGRMEWKPVTFKMRYLPGDQCDVPTLANELIERGLVVLYEVDGKKYAEIPTFTEHQVINNREAESPNPARVGHAVTPQNGGVVRTPNPARVGHASCTRDSRVEAEGKEGREGKERKEGSGREHCREDAPPPEDDSEKKQNSTRMKKPTVDEVREFCREHNLGMDAEAFIAYFESNGWKVGKNSMVDWKSAARGWAKRERDNWMHHGGSQKPRIPTMEEERARKPAGGRS